MKAPIVVPKGPFHFPFPRQYNIKNRYSEDDTNFQVFNSTILYK